MTKRIFDCEPANWKELQSLVKQMFDELGCAAIVDHPLPLVRGKKKIDVYVEDKLISPSQTYLCECKYWSKPIPQEVIHSFRTVVADSGANRGFIISTVGFQKGAHEAVVKTNIELVTFNELQKPFYKRWVQTMYKICLPYSDRLFPYWDYGGKLPKIPWGDTERRKLLDLNYKYSVLIEIGPHDILDIQKEFPAIVPDPNSNATDKGTITVESFRQYFELALSLKDKAYKDYQNLFGERKGA